MIGRELESVDGKTLIFEGNTEIELKKGVGAKAFVGKRLTNVEDQGDESMRLSFGDSFLELKKGSYLIDGIDPHAQADVNAGLPVDPSPDRITEGPSDDEVREELDARQSTEEAGDVE